MKKRLLFVIPGFGIGGAEKSLVNLLGALDYEKFTVDVFAFDPTGLFAAALPEQVRVLPLGQQYTTAKLPLMRSVWRFITRAQPSAAYHRIAYSITLRRFGFSDRAEQYAWKHYAKLLPVLEDDYDAAIGYLEKSANYFTTDNTLATVKIGYIHTEYQKLRADKDFDAAYFARMRYVVTVSDSCAKSLAQTFPEHAQKIRVVENLLSKQALMSLATAPCDDMPAFDGTVLLTVGRLSEEKGMDLAVDACKALIIDGLPVKWYHIGAGEAENKILKTIQKKGLEASFVLLGSKANPYPYFARCDLYVQPSRYEGKAIAVEEAKLLGVPVVATAYDTVGDQLEDGVTGFVCAVDSVALAEKIKTLIQNEAMRERVKNRLSALCGNESDIQKFYDLLT